MQKLGQHFLNNDAVLKKIINAIELSDGGMVIEIGPGRGALTIPLATACETARCHLVAIEKDTALAAALTATFTSAPRKATGPEIIQGDALKLLPTIVEAAIKKTSKYFIVGNIPYYITGKLLRIISELERKPQQCVFMVQREVAERICAKPPAMSRLSASVQFWANASTIAAVPKTDFIPRPNVDSAVILLAKKDTMPEIDADHYYYTVRSVFAQPRKTILNNLLATKESTPRTEIETLLKKIGVDPAGRPQDLSVEKLVAIAGSMGITL